MASLESYPEMIMSNPHPVGTKKLPRYTEAEIQAKRQRVREGLSKWQKAKWEVEDEKDSENELDSK
jgi:hypothetical protein